MAGTSAYVAAAAQLDLRAGGLETGAYYLGASSISGNSGPFMDPVGESFDRCVAALSDAAADCRRLAGICRTRAELVAAYDAAVSRWRVHVMNLDADDPRPPYPMWPHPWRRQ